MASRLVCRERRSDASVRVGFSQFAFGSAREELQAGGSVDLRPFRPGLLDGVTAAANLISDPKLVLGMSGGADGNSKLAHRLTVERPPKDECVALILMRNLVE